MAMAEAANGRLVIVGGGQAGFALAARLRALGDLRPVTMLCAEASLPYQRPPLSKKYLLGEMALDRLQFRPEAWYRDNAIELRLSTRVAAIDRAAACVVLDDGERVGYDRLALATGATPRQLPSAIGGDLEGVFTLRDFRDADRLSQAMAVVKAAGRRALIVGGGYIGLEAAAVARLQGLDVTLIEMADRILQRVAASATSALVAALHRGRGVDLREGAALSRLEGRDGRVVAAHLADGTVLPVDLVIAGIGVAANDALAREAGLATGNGILVDAFGRTQDPAIYAMGDCALVPFEDMAVRLESVQNAVDQAEAVAAHLAGSAEPYRPKPWFWSDQYDVKLQIAGFGLGHDETLTRPGAREGAVSVWYFRGGRLIAVDALNDAKAYVTGKKLIEMGVTPERVRLADPATDLKSLLPA
ncbi:NAD(P)/FAD-dependent oxidoreductase [Rhizobium rhizosphaerae]|nr:FAD-dependent oxidoreductase [Xaviernesmea rhizosphaerae]